MNTYKVPRAVMRAEVSQRMQACGSYGISMAKYRCHAVTIFEHKRPIKTPCGLVDPCGILCFAIRGEVRVKFLPWPRNEKDLLAMRKRVDVSSKTMFFVPWKKRCPRT